MLIIGKLTSLTHSTSPAENLIIFCDPKFDPDWKILSDLPHVVMVSEPADCVAAIASVKAELERRKRQPDKRKLILVIDEYADFLGDLPKDTLVTVESQIRSITSVGRSLGIHVDPHHPKPTIEIVDSIAKGNLTTRCGGMVMTSKESEIAMGAVASAARRCRAKVALRHHRWRSGAAHPIPSDRRRRARRSHR